MDACPSSPMASMADITMLLHAQVLRNYQAGDIQVPFWLSVYNVNYGRAAMALNWRALWLGEGAITGVVEEVGGLIPCQGLSHCSSGMQASRLRMWQSVWLGVGAITGVVEEVGGVTRCQ